MGPSSISSLLVGPAVAEQVTLELVVVAVQVDC